MYCCVWVIWLVYINISVWTRALLVFQELHTLQWKRTQLGCPEVTGMNSVCLKDSFFHPDSKFLLCSHYWTIYSVRCSAHGASGRSQLPCEGRWSLPLLHSEPPLPRSRAQLIGGGTTLGPALRGLAPPVLMVWGPGCERWRAPGHSAASGGVWLMECPDVTQL